MATNIDGLVTGINTASIIEGLQAIQQRQIDLLSSRKATIVRQQAAFGGLESRMLAFKSEIARLTRTQDNVFQSRQVAVSDEDALSATASAGAGTGVYQLTVQSLAKAHQVASQGYADADAALTEGEFKIRVGAGLERTIVVGSSNATLQGLADAINASGAGVSASIIQDSATPAAPYRLLLTSGKTGADHEISITSGLAASTGDAVRPEFDFDNPVQAGQDATVTLGSGAGAITVASDTNRITGLVAGVTLDLHAADPALEITLSIQADAETGVTAVQGFVDSYNGLMEFVDQLSRFDPETQSAGPLLGNRDAYEIQNTIRSTLLGVVPGASTRMNRLSALGVTVNDAGRLDVNTTRLQDVIAGRVEGVTGDDVRRLFALDGVSNHPNVRFLLGSSRTVDGATPYEVDVTQAAERASVTATSELAGSIVIDGTNQTFSLNVDGQDSSTLTLAAGTYTPQELATQLAAVINADEELAGRQVGVTVVGGSLQITSASYGSSSKIDVSGGTALAALGLDGSEADTGQDVAGRFLVNGQIETATGRGRVLTGALENAHTADLQVQITLTAAQIQAGSEANVTVTRGLAARLDQVLGSLLDSQTGRVKKVDDRFDDTVADIDATIKRHQERAAAQQESLLKQFAAMEAAVSQLQSTSSYLASQLGGVSSLKTGA